MAGFAGIALDPVEFLDVVSSRDIRKVAKWLEKKYREVIVPIVREYPLLAALEEPTGQKVGEFLGGYAVQKYETCSSEQKQQWDASRWLHHGAIGELLVIRERKKRKPFLVGVGKGLMNSDLLDRSQWHSPAFWKAKEVIEKMR